MIILKANPPKPSLPWWLGEWTTPCCGSTLLLEHIDLCSTRVKVLNPGEILVACPVCLHPVRRVKP